MTAKTSKARTEAFFKALAETGNQTIAAERACVSRSWVTKHRASDPAFKTRMEGAIAQARARLTASGSAKPASVLGTKWGNIHGEELVVRGTGGSGGGRRAQVSRARVGQITPRVEERFLDVLHRTCNVKLACAAVGLSAAAFYKHRERWVEFGRAWDAAAADGEVALECALLENGIRSLDAELGHGSDALADAPALPMQPMSADDALRILGMRRAQVTHRRKAVGNRRLVATEEETNAALLKRLHILRLRHEREAAGEQCGKGKGLRRVKGSSG